MLVRTIIIITFLAASATASPADDPTRPPAPAEIRAWFAGETGDGTRATSWTLQSVLISDARSVAVINGQRVQVGDTVGDADVVVIEPARVVLEHDGEQISLTIDNRLQSVRQPSSD